MIKRYISNRQIAEDTDDTQDPIDPTDNTNTLGDVFQAIKRAILTVKEFRKSIEETTIPSTT